MAITITHDAPQSHTALLPIRHSSFGPPHPPLMPCTPSLPLPCPTRPHRMMRQAWVDSVGQYCLLSLDACSSPACHPFTETGLGSPSQSWSGSGQGGIFQVQAPESPHCPSLSAISQLCNQLCKSMHSPLPAVPCTPSSTGQKMGGKKQQNKCYP